MDGIHNVAGTGLGPPTARNREDASAEGNPCPSAFNILVGLPKYPLAMHCDIHHLYLKFS